MKLVKKLKSTISFEETLKRFNKKMADKQGSVTKHDNLRNSPFSKSIYPKIYIYIFSLQKKPSKYFAEDTSKLPAKVSKKKQPKKKYLQLCRINLSNYTVMMTVIIKQNVDIMGKLMLLS